MPYRKTGSAAFDAMRPGDLIAVKPQGDGWVLRNIPGVSGGMVVQNPHNGRIYAMQGGFDSSLSDFNRATQAKRPPGSTIRSDEHTSELQSLMRISYAVFCLKQKTTIIPSNTIITPL